MAEERNIALGGDAPQPQGNELAMLHFLDRLEDESQAVEKNLRDNWKSNLAWYRGQQWTVTNRQPLFMANKLGEIVQRKAAKLTEMKPQLMVQARREGLMTTSNVIQKTIEAGWDEYGLQSILADLAQHMEIFGCGVLQLGYDPMADFGNGDITPGIFDPRYFHMDPAIKRAQDLDKAAYVWTSAVMSTSEIRRRWPGRGNYVSADSGDYSENSVQARIARLFSSRGGGDGVVPEAIPRAFVKEYWFHDPTLGQDGKPRYPGGRHVIRAGDVILKDEPNPYFHQRWPYVLIDETPDPEHPWGRSDIQNLKRLQNAINRIGHLFVENSILTGNTWITADQNALMPTTMRRLSNIGAIIIEKMTGREVTRQEPPPMPPHMMQFVDLAMRLMDQLAGLSDTTVSSQGRAEVRSEAQLEGLQQAGETLLRATARRVEAGLERLGQRWIAAIFQFYTRDRTLAFLGPTNEWETYEFERTQLLQEVQAATRNKAVDLAAARKVRDNFDKMQADAQKQLWNQFVFKITPGSSLSSVRAARASVHGELARQGLLSATHVLRDLGFANPEEEIDKAMKEMQAFQLARGEGQGQDNKTSSMRQAM